MMDFKTDFKTFLKDRVNNVTHELQENGQYKLLESYLKQVSELNSDLAKNIETVLKYTQAIECEAVYNTGFQDGVALQEMAHPELFE